MIMTNNNYTTITNIINRTTINNITTINKIENIKEEEIIIRDMFMDKGDLNIQSEFIQHILKIKASFVNKCPEHIQHVSRTLQTMSKNHKVIS